MRKILLLLVLVLTTTAQAQLKREFRGAWIQCVNGQFQGMSTQQMQQTLSYQLDELQKDGVNAIIFQVRPECDALYASELEPWSRFLTGVQGKAPSPYWDPLQWMVEQCHRRGMELHAWINPYRAKTKGTTALAANHVGILHPERCFRYDDLLILNPGEPENRFYICEVVADIVKRYDVDGLHIDDYFYPYPVAGQTIPDDAQYQQYSNGIKNKGDWRRYNVSLFVKQLYETVHKVKPWVKVGISPFGIYRNKKNDPMGSNTNGLQNYDDLYAEVLLWINNGWLDYCVPQLYWEIGHKSADYDTLIRWWNQYAGGRPLYIGEDIGCIDSRVAYLPQLGLNIHACSFGNTRHLAADGHILLERKSRAIEHHRSKAQAYGLHAGVEALPMIKVNANRYGRPFGGFEVKRSHQLHRCFGELHFGKLQDNGRTQLFSSL